MAKLCVMTCEGFYPELAAVIGEQGCTEVAVTALPAYCGRPPWNWEQIAARLPEVAPDKVMIVGNACLAQPPQPPPGQPTLELLKLEQCFHLLAPAPLVDELLAAGAYLMTPSWLKHWQERVAELGFPGESAAGYFQQFARKLVLIDTGTEGELNGELAAISAALGLRGEQIAVGLDHLRLRMRALVAEERCQAAQQALRRSEQERRSAQAESLAVLDLLTRLSQAQQESQIIEHIEEIFRMLFAPEIYYLLPWQEGRLCAPVGMAAEYGALAANRQAAYAWTSSGKGFVVALRRGEVTLGVVVADQLAFAEYKERYLGLALSIAGVAALALEETRNRKRLLESEKMASLGGMIAGVAHEINTPTGVCLAAATTLEGQSQKLCGLFASRQMKQSDLSGYLEVAQAETRLMVSNLDRIGRLIESFRQVAVEKSPPLRRRVGLRQLIEDVVNGMGRGDLGENLEVAIECDTALQVDTYSGDWSSILTNLYSNSLRYAFKGRTRGRIRISARMSEEALAVEYADDGVGLSEEVRQHIFDPFYTTDLQHGMGLGMHLVYNLVSQRFGGSIECDTGEAGVRFRIQAPQRGSE